MDYEKRYNEALEKVKKLYTVANGSLITVTKAWLEKIFPELRESEDEMIRRTLVEYFGPEVQLDFVRGVPIQKIRDWLEKQKELDKKIIEKANAYDEALRIATDSFNDTDKHVKATLRRIFPSLSCITAERQKEDTAPNSNELIALWDTEKKKLNENCCGDWWGLARNAFMDGFKLGLKEKQKEHKPTSFNEPYNPDDYEVVMEGNATSLKRKEQKPCEDSGTDGDIMQYIEEGEKRGIKEVISFPEKYGLQKEQKPIWNEEDERIIKDAIYALEEVGGYPCIVKELKSIRPIKQEWSEEDEKMVKFYEDDFNNRIGNMPMKDVVEMRLKFKNWIANRIKFLRPQSKREWSEEDKKMLADIIVFISGYADKRVVAEWVNFLKSLRSSWKPSEEQIAVLWDAISNLKHDGYKKIDTLISLYEQLRKL